VKGIEPSSSAWKAVALPLSYTRAGNRTSEFRNQHSISEGVLPDHYNSRFDFRLPSLLFLSGRWWGK
jgi:hypothetical protein